MKQDAFTVTRIPLYLTAPGVIDCCPPGDWGYRVVCHLLTVDEVQRLWDDAQRQTLMAGCHCGGPLFDAGRLEFTLAHALEHLVVMDLIHRGRLILGPEFLTLGLTCTLGDGSPDGATVFYVRDGLVRDAEVDRSVARVVRHVTRSYARGVLGRWDAMTGLRQVTASLCKGAGLVLVGLVFGAVLTVHILVTYGERVSEHWTWTDAVGQVWACSRIPGMSALCSHTREGTMVFADDGTPEPLPCTIRTTVMRP